MHRSPYESGNVKNDANQVTSQISSTVTEVFSEKDTSLLGKREFLTMQLDVIFFSAKVMLMVFKFVIDCSGSDTVKTVKSVTKRIQLASPGKW